DLGVVPIVNENDTVAIEELAFGDNDNLSALTASLVEADLLVILSDVEGLHTRDPRLDPDAPLVRVARAQDESVARAAGPAKSSVGTGGMASKLAAARKAAAAGIPTLIADGTREGVLAAIFDPAAETGTLLLADGDRLAHRKHWIAYALNPAGDLHLDAGAERALAKGGRSLLPSGVRGVVGGFGVGDCVRCLGPDGREFARGLVNYGAAELEKIKGARTLAGASTAAKDAALRAAAARLRRDEAAILRANADDVARARAAGESAAFVDRLTLTTSRIDAMARGLEEIAALPDPVGETI